MIIALITGRKMVWNINRVTQSVHKTLRRMSIAALKGTLLKIAFTGRDKTKLGKVKCSTQIRSRLQNILTKLMGNWRSKERQ